MFVPPYDAILNALGTSREELEGEEKMSIPTDFLRFLLQRLVETSDFDTTVYLGANPDIADAIRRRRIADAKQHYISYGYLEGRRGATKVDESWYLQANPDVADAVRKRMQKSGQDHYNEGGSIEFRTPNKALEEQVKMWATLLKQR